MFAISMVSSFISYCKQIIGLHDIPKTQFTCHSCKSNNRPFFFSFFFAYIVTFQQTAPKDKLLVFNMNDGWGPLCQFLDVDIPDKPFPYKNVKGSIVDEYIKTLPLVQQAKTEIIISISLLSLVVGFGVYKIANRGNFRFVSELLKSITSLIK